MPQLFMSNTITRMSGENLTALQAYVTSGFQALATRVAGSFDQIGSVSSQPVSSQPAMQTSSPVGSTALTQDKPSQNYAANQVKSTTSTPRRTPTSNHVGAARPASRQGALP